MNNYWTQELPKISGYYWFAYEYGDDAKIQWIEVDEDDEYYVTVWDYSDDGEICLLTTDGYYYSAYPIEGLLWKEPRNVTSQNFGLEYGIEEK